MKVVSSKLMEDGRLPQALQDRSRVTRKLNSERGAVEDSDTLEDGRPFMPWSM